jgi:hypothetical protein
MNAGTQVGASVLAMLAINPLHANAVGVNVAGMARAKTRWVIVETGKGLFVSFRDDGCLDELDARWMKKLLWLQRRDLGGLCRQSIKSSKSVSVSTGRDCVPTSSGMNFHGDGSCWMSVAECASDICGSCI